MCLCRECRVRGDGLGNAVAAKGLGYLIPPAPLLTTSAESISDALHFHPSLAEFMQLREFLTNTTSTLAFDLSASDGASGNIRLLAHELNVVPPWLLQDYITCRNHATHLVQGTVVCSRYGLKAISDLYAST